MIGNPSLKVLIQAMKNVASAAIFKSGISCWEAAMSGKKEQGRSNTVPIRGYRLRAKRGRQSRVLQRANRQVTLMAAAVIIAFFVAVTLQALLT
ncbi:hypothetical protein CCGE525_05935 [Rhizobium jaguaris]|uniref:Uncharacterized protein n=1 Tax=Rhizobium jaguaris TaxID=1312183 RepID=A0A387FJB0_9HYPH|nr:hypothetical protein CCGE525_05935 [Rhizobium jaguaris]